MQVWQSTFRVGKYKCHLTLNERASIHAAWEPRMPPRHGLTEKEIDQYKAARNALVEEAAKVLGPIVVVDI